MPSMDEVKKAVFNLNGDSASGSDVFTGLFYQKCWEIIGSDLYRMVDSLFVGNTLPKFITHTNLVLLPRKNDIHSFLDLQPISLSNFVNKVISRVIHDMLGLVLPRLISSNQSGFVKERNIIENVLLTQEIYF